MKANEKNWAIVGAIAAIVIVVAVVIARTNSFTQTDKEGSSIAFTFNAQDTYVHAKENLAKHGWNVVIPPSYEDSSGITSSTTTPIDATFPEIAFCGSGRDAICTVDFTNGTETNHLDIQSMDRNGKEEWIVVGSE